MVEHDVGSVGERRSAELRIELGHAHAREHAHPCVLVPRVRAQPQRLDVATLRRQQRPEPHAVVGPVRLAADERDRHVRVTVADGLADRLARDAAPDDQDAGPRVHQTAAEARLGMRVVATERRT